VTEKLTGPRSWQEIGSGMCPNQGSCAQLRREQAAKSENINSKVPFPWSAPHIPEGPGSNRQSLARPYWWYAGRLTWLGVGWGGADLDGLLTFLVEILFP
jgi:hypothetical protein